MENTYLRLAQEGGRKVACSGGGLHYPWLARQIISGFPYCQAQPQFQLSLADLALLPGAGTKKVAILAIQDHRIFLKIAENLNKNINNFCRKALKP